jgi:hypothetical protein
MKFTTHVRVHLEGAPAQALPRVKVSLHDRDRITPDDHIATARTDDAGVAAFTYYSKDFVDLDERLGGLYPELYVVLRDARDQVVLTTRSDAEKNQARREIVVAVPRNLAERHDLLAAPGR